MAPLSPPSALPTSVFDRARSVFTALRTRLLGVGLVLLSAIGYGFMPTLAHQAYGHGIGLATLILERYLVATVVFWLVIRARRLPLPGRGAALRALVFGGVLMTVPTWTYFAATTRIDASLAVLLVYLYPVLVVAASLCTAAGRSRASRTTLTALAVACLGLALVLATGLSGGPVDGIGVGLALLCALSYAAQTLGISRFAAGMHPMVFAALVTTGGLATTAIAAVGAGNLGELAVPGAWPYSMVLGAACTVVALSAFTAGVAMVGPATASIVSCAEVLVACGAAAAVLGERLTPVQLLGGAAVLASAVLVVRGSGGSGPDPEPQMEPVRDQDVQPVRVPAPRSAPDDQAAVAPAVG